MLDTKLLKPRSLNGDSLQGPLIIRTFEKRVPGLKTGVEKDIFWSEMGQDLENRAAHPHQEFPGVHPLGAVAA